MRRLGTAVGAVFALLLLTAGPAAADLPQPVDTSTFQDVTLAHSLTAPTVVKFAPNGLGTRMFIALKSGIVLAYDQPDDPNPTQVIDLSTEVDDFWDRGLLGMTLSPGFNESGGYMYLLYARDAAIGGSPPRWNDACPSPPGAEEGGCVISGKLVRVPIGALGSPTGPVQTLIQDQWCQQFPSHSVGTVAFGPDGKLYVSAGDGASFDGADWGQYGYPSINPCHDPYNAADPTKSEGGALRAQDVRTPGDPTGLNGTIIRVDPATGAPAAGNPFTGPDTNAKRIIAYGMRNPFRFTFRPNTGDIWVGDVGWTSIEEIDKVPTTPPAKTNLGWPCYEGAPDNPGYDQQSLCLSLPVGQTTTPEFFYWHGENVVAGDGCDLSTGSAISGLAFLPSTSNYPARFHGGLFFTDYARNCIWFAPALASGEPDFNNVEVFARGPAGVGPVDLEIAPDGNLVFVFHDQTFGEIHEIRPVDQPTAKIDVTGPDGHNFTFDGSGSTPAGLTYAWDTNNDHLFDNGSNPTVDVTFPGRAAKIVSLKVTKNGISDTSSVRVSVGNTPPSTPTITKVSVPPAWATGDHLKFSGSAVDPDSQDSGHLTYTWVMTILHCPSGAGCHKHPVQTLTGPTAEFVAPAHAYPSKLLITLQATDTLGFSSALATLELEPRAIDFTTRATPPPFTVSLNGIQGNSVAETLIAGTPVTVTTTTPQMLGGRPYGFAGWSDGDRHLARTVAPRSTSTLTARFVRLPASTAAPTIAGDTRTSHTLTGSPGGWTDATSLSYQWLRCASSCAPISGATARTYTLGAADLGARLVLRVTAHNAGGAASALSARTTTITDGTPPALTLGGTRKVKLGQGRLRIRVGCPSERCRLRLTPVLLIKGRAPIATSRATKRSLDAAQKATVTVRLSTRQRRAAAKALGAHKRVKVRVDVTAADTSGNRSARSFSVTLKH